MTMNSAAKSCLINMLVLVFLLPGTLGTPGQGVPNSISLSSGEWGGTSLQRFGPWVQVQRFVVPRYVGLGGNMSLECDYVVQEHATLYSLKWYKGSSQFYQYIPSKTQQPHAVFSVPGLHSRQLAGGREGRVVRVMGVGLTASDVYRCELVAEGPPFHTTQRSANMTVVVLPRGPPLITGNKRYYQVNQRLDLNCTAPPARPAPALTWTVNGNQVSTSPDHLITPEEHILTSTGLERSTTHLSVLLAHHHFQDGVLTVVCEARLGALYTRSRQVTIPEPSSRWFSSLNLYRASDTGRTAPSVALVVTVWALLSLCQVLH